MATETSNVLTTQMVVATSGVSTINSSSINSSSTTSSSSSISTLFERVTNFRRSLIKSQNKKNKIRPPSGSFSFLKHSASNLSIDSKMSASDCSATTTAASATVNLSQSVSSSALIPTSNGHTHHTHHSPNGGSSQQVPVSSSHPVPNNYHPGSSDSNNDSTVQYSSVSLCGELQTAPPPPPPLPPSHSHQQQRNHHQQQQQHRRNSIIVDEEDAIYGFTSSHLNNPGPVRRHLKLQSANHHNHPQHGTNLISSSIGGQASSSSSSTLTSRTTASSSSSTSSPPHPIYAGTGPITNGSIHNTSSSCVSLYETIDEVESTTATATLPPLKQNCAKSKVLPPPPPLPASYKLRGKALRSHDTDWKRNRRSSAIIFGTDFSSNDNNGGDDQNVDDFEDETSASASGTVNHHHNHNHQGQQAGLYSNRPSRSHHLSSSIFHRHSSVSSGPLPPMPPCPSSSMSMHRSSDDLLMMSSSYQQPGPYHNHNHHNGAHLPAFPNQPNRIYENVANHNHHQNHRQKPSQQHHSRAASNSLSTTTSKRCDSRKLTKDSGYESASTLVNSSLTQLNQLPNLSDQLPLPPPPPPPAPLAAPPVSTFFFGGNSAYRQQSNQSSINHSRSQSIDSTLSSNGNGNYHRTCNDDHLRSLTPPIAINNHNHNNRFCQNGTSPNHQNLLPLPPPPLAADDSPPPTPPVRYSSLAENHRSSTRLNRNGRGCGGGASASVDEDDDLEEEEELDQMIMSDGIVVVSGSNLDPNGTSHHRQHSHHQLDQLSTKQLYSLVRDLAPGAVTAVSPPVLPPKKTGIRMPIEYHHVKQDSWPPLSYGANGSATAALAATAAPAPASNGNGNFGYASSQQQQSPNNNRRSRHNNNNNSNSNSNHHHSSNYHHHRKYCGTTETVSSSSMITQSLTSLLANHPMNDRQRSLSSNNKTTPGHSGHGRHSIASCGTNSTVSNCSSSLTTTTSTTSLNCSRIPTTTSTSSANVNGGGGAYPTAQHQIAHSRQVQQIARQESATMIVNQKQQQSKPTQLNGRLQNRRYSLELLDSSESNHNNLEQSNSKPPPLPPKSFQSSMSTNGHDHQNNFDKQAELSIFSNGAATNGEKQNYKRSVSHNETIKEIQKRAVYEFYLREKEKKNKNKTNINTTNGTREQSNLDNSNFNSKQNGTGSHVSRNSQINNIANNKHRTNEFELRYNNHIKHLNGDNRDLEVTNNGEFEEEEEEELPLPPPPPPQPQQQQQQLPLLSTDLDEFYVPPSTVVSNNFETTFTASRSICTTIRNRSPSPAPSRESLTSPSLPLPPPPPVQFSNSPPNSPNALDLPPPPTPTTPSENHNGGTTNGGPTSSEFFLNQRMSLALPPSLENHGSTILTTESALSSALSLNCQLGYLQTRPLVNKFMFYDIDFASLWPIVDFGRIWPSGEVNLWLANGMVVNGGHKSTVKLENGEEDDEEEEEEEIDDEELVNIELNHRNKQQLIDQISLLRTRQAKLKLEYDDNEKIGQLIRDRLTALDSNNNNNNNNGAKGDSAANMASKEKLRSDDATKPQSQPSLSHDRQKLDLFCNDMIMIVRLIVSIVEQVNRNTTVQTNNIKHQLIRVIVADSQHGDLTGSASFEPTKIAKTTIGENNADTAEHSDESPISDSFDQKQSRLFGQLAEAKRLRDNIETRRTMLEQRLRRKAASCTAAYATSSTSSSSSSSISACGGIFVINLEQLNLATSSSVAASVISALNVNTTANNHQTTAVFSLTALLRHYLSNQESLLVLQEVAKLLHDDLNSRLSQLTTKSTNSTISSNVVATAL